MFINNQKLPGSKGGGGGGGGAVVPNTLLDAHAFSTSIREFLQIPKTTGKKRKETDSSPTDETPGKIMRTGTTEQWKKVVPKNGRRKASPKHKAGTIPFNPKLLCNKSMICVAMALQNLIIPRSSSVLSINIDACHLLGFLMIKRVIY